MSCQLHRTPFPETVPTPPGRLARAFATAVADPGSFDHQTVEAPGHATAEQHDVSEHDNDPGEHGVGTTLGGTLNMRNQGLGRRLPPTIPQALKVYVACGPSHQSSGALA
jgi:hypothetical protein